MNFCFHRGKIPKWILSIKISSFISFSARRNVMHMQRFDSWPDSTNVREVSSCWLLFALPPPATHFLPVLSVTRRASHVVLLLLFFHRSISLLFPPMPCVSKTRAISDAYKNKRCIAYCSFRFSPLNSSQINRVFFLFSLSLRHGILTTERREGRRSPLHISRLLLCPFLSLPRIDRSPPPRPRRPLRRDLRREFQRSRSLQNQVRSISPSPILQNPRMSAKFNRVSIEISVG